jgi:uncharacterized coiled-coil protein SlyX
MYGVFDLTRLPPLDLNSIDITSITQDIKKIKHDIAKTNESPVDDEKMLELTNDIIAMKQIMSSMQSQLTQLTKTVDSNRPSIIPATPRKAPSVLKLPPDIARITTGSARKLPPTPESGADGPGAIPKSGSSGTGFWSLPGRDTRRDYSNAVKQPPKLQLQPEPPNHSNSNKTQTIPKTAPNTIGSAAPQRRPRQNCVVGKGQARATGLNGRGRFVSLFLSRFEPDVESNTVKKYVDEKFKVSFTCEKMKTRYDSYSSFKVEGYCKSTDAFFDAENWPEDILVRRFYQARKNNPL